MTFTITLSDLAARNLKNQDGFLGKSDPYCTINIAGQYFKTVVINNNLNPRWNETFTVPNCTNGEKLVMKVFDKDTGLLSANDGMGEAQILLNGLYPGAVIDSWFPLKGKKAGKGEVHVRATCQGVPQQQQFQPPQQQFAPPPQQGFNPQQQQFHPQQGFNPQQQQFHPQTGQPLQGFNPQQQFGGPHHHKKKDYDSSSSSSSSSSSDKKKKKKSKKHKKKKH